LRERIKDKDAAIEDLRRRLDGEIFEHRQERERLHGIIEKQTLLLAAPKQEPTPPPKKKRWWHFSRSIFVVDRYIDTKPLQWMIAYTMSLSARQAAEQLGLSKQGIIKAI